MREEARFVPLVSDFFGKVAGEQVRAIGFEEEAVRGNNLHKFAKVISAALVADPAGDSYITAK
jgi:hypothetical protein